MNNVSLTTVAITTNMFTRFNSVYIVLIFVPLLLASTCSLGFSIDHWDWSELVTNNDNDQSSSSPSSHVPANFLNSGTQRYQDLSPKIHINTVPAPGASATTITTTKPTSITTTTTAAAATTTLNNHNNDINSSSNNNKSEIVVVPRWFSHDWYTTTYAPVRSLLWMHERVLQQQKQQNNNNVKSRNGAIEELNNNKLERQRTYVDTAIKVWIQRAKFRMGASNSLAYINELSDWSVDEIKALKEAFSSLARDNTAKMKQQPQPQQQQQQQLQQPNNDSNSGGALQMNKAQSMQLSALESVVLAQQQQKSGDKAKFQSETATKIDDKTITKVRQFLASAADNNGTNELQQALLDELKATRDTPPFTLSKFARQTLAQIGPSKVLPSNNVAAPVVSPSQTTKTNVPSANATIVASTHAQSRVVPVSQRPKVAQTVGQKQQTIQSKQQQQQQDIQIDVAATRRLQAAIDAQILSQLERQISEQFSAQLGPNIQVRARNVYITPRNSSTH